MGTKSKAQCGCSSPPRMSDIHTLLHLHQHLLHSNCPRSAPPLGLQIYVHPPPRSPCHTQGRALGMFHHSDKSSRAHSIYLRQMGTPTILSTISKPIKIHIPTSSPPLSHKNLPPVKLWSRCHRYSLIPLARSIPLWICIFQIYPFRIFFYKI